MAVFQGRDYSLRSSRKLAYCRLALCRVPALALTHFSLWGLSHHDPSETRIYGCLSDCTFFLAVEGDARSMDVIWACKGIQKCYLA